MEYSFDKREEELLELPGLNLPEPELEKIKAEAREEINNYLEIFG
jgi:hypothetical protein